MFTRAETGEAGSNLKSSLFDEEDFTRAFLED